MTTNVYDKKVGLLTSDSRWSISQNGWIAYVDDTGYDKIIFDKRLAFLFAGNLSEINHWKEWVTAGRKKDEKPLDHLKDMSVLQVDVANGSVVFQRGEFEEVYFGAAKIPSAMFGGTGGSAAKTCWSVNKCAVRAVKSAIQEDHFSGGEAMFFNRSDLSNNVKNIEAAPSVKQQAKERGIIMNTTNSQTSILIKDAVNDPSNPVAQALANTVMSGSASFTAPFHNMDKPWTDDEKAAFEKALSLYDED